MSAKKFLIVTGLLLVGVIYYYMYRDSFVKRDLQVFVTLRPRMPGIAAAPAAEGASIADMVIFGLGREVKLTSLKVVPVAAETNKFPHACWEMVADSNSQPTSTFTYGGEIPGMHPTVAGAAPEPLQPNTSYRVFVKAGSQRGEHEFKTRGEPLASE